MGIVIWLLNTHKLNYGLVLMGGKRLVKSGGRRATRKSYNLNARIKSALRKVWLWSPYRRDALKAAKISPNLFYCARCRRPHPKVQVDHIVQVAGEGGWDGYVSRLFCPPDQLQCLCHECHLKKTKEDRDGNPKYKKGKASPSIKR